MAKQSMTVRETCENKKEFFQLGIRPTEEAGWKFVESLGLEYRAAVRCQQDLSRLGSGETLTRAYLNKVVQSVHEDFDSAQAIVESLSSPKLLESSDRVERLHRIRAEQVLPLSYRHFKRQKRTKTFQGYPVKVDDRDSQLVYYGASEHKFQILLKIVERLHDRKRIPEDPLNRLWMTIDEKDAIWLYHHSDDKKWQCFHFRIELLGSDGNLRPKVRMYVPFGIDGDSANYQREASEVYINIAYGWKLSYKTTASWNQSRSCSFSDSRSRGESVNKMQGGSLASRKGTAKTENQTRTSTDTTGINQNQSSGGATSSGRGGSGGYKNWNEGISSSWNFSTGTMQQHSDALSQGNANTISEDRTSMEQWSTARMESETQTETVAISEGDRRSMARTPTAWGIASGVLPETLLEFWRNGPGNEDVSDLFDSTRETVFSILRSVGGSIGSRGGILKQKGGHERRADDMAKMRKLVLVEAEWGRSTTFPVPQSAPKSIEEVADFGELENTAPDSVLGNEHEILIAELIEEGVSRDSRLSAVKYVQERKGWGIAESRKWVEEHYEQH